MKTVEENLTDIIGQAIKETAAETSRHNALVERLKALGNTALKAKRLANILFFGKP